MKEIGSVRERVQDMNASLRSRDKTYIHATNIAYHFFLFSYNQKTSRMSEEKNEEIGLQDRKEETNNNTPVVANNPPSNGNMPKNKKAEEGKSSPKKDSYKSRIQRAMRTRPHLFLIFIISIMGFCYHFHLALNQYWDYKTTVSFSNEDPPDYKFQYPSATLCFQDVAPYYKLIESFPEYKEAVDKVVEEMKRRNDSLFWNKPETKNYIDIGGLKLEGKLLYLNFNNIDNLFLFSQIH